MFSINFSKFHKPLRSFRANYFNCFYRFKFKSFTRVVRGEKLKNKSKRRREFKLNQNSINKVCIKHKIASIRMTFKWIFRKYQRFVNFHLWNAWKYRVENFSFLCDCALIFFLLSIINFFEKKKQCTRRTFFYDL
jgi:hypothetical protein